MAENTTPKSQFNSQVNITDILFLALHRWPWFLLSVVLCLGVAELYLLRTPSLYTRSAEILIKSDSQNKGAGTDMGAFASMGFIQINNNINDEVNKLKSPDIMEHVIKRLNLDMSYSVDGKFHKDILYGTDLPLTVSFLSLHENESATAEIEVSANGKAKMINLMSGTKEIPLPNGGAFTFGDTLNCRLGQIVINKTPYFMPGKHYAIYVAKNPIQGVINMFRSELNVSVKSDKGSIIVLSATDRSIQRAEDLLNTVIDVYNDNWMKTKNQISVSTSEFINERLAVIEGELGNIDQDISSFKSEHQTPDVSQAASMYMSENQEANARLLDLNNQLQMVRYLRNFVTDTDKRNQTLPAISGVGGSSIDNQIQEYNTMIIQRNQYVANSSDNNPMVMNLDSQLAALRTGIIQSIDNQIVVLNTSIKNIQNNRNRVVAQIVANPSQAKYLLSVERQQKVKEALYLFLLQKREENELSQAFTAYNTEVITYPTGSNSPVSPDNNKILIIAFLLGVALPFGIIYLKETTNTKIRGRKDLQDLTLPFLGEIPRYETDKNKKKNDDHTNNVVVKEGKRDVINEAFRVLRTNLEFMNVNSDKANVIAFTSFNPGSGKSFISMNLGYTLAIKKKRVLIIDSDMRHGSTSAYIGSPETGLSDYLSGKLADVHDAICEYDGLPSLHILPVGTMPPNPTELLENGRLEKIVDSFREEYDYILFDCPPIEVVADTQIVDKFVDRTVFIVRAGLLERAMLEELEKIFNDKKFKNMAMILNGTTSYTGRYGYGYARSYRYGYGYGYGYGYHYGSDKKSSSKKK